MKKVNCNDCQKINIIGSHFGYCFEKHKEVDLKYRQCKYYKEKPKAKKVINHIEITEFEDGRIGITADVRSNTQLLGLLEFTKNEIFKKINKIDENEKEKIIKTDKI